MMQETVTILIASYQSGNDLKAAVESTLAQDYPRKELIICDDGSDEAITVDLLNQFSAQGIRIVRQKVNRGTVRNLNAGLRCSEGQWVITLAADDRFKTIHSITQLVSEAYDTQAQWVVGRTELVGCENVWIDKSPIEDIESNTNPYAFFETLCYSCWLPSSGNLYRRSFLEQFGLYDERYYLVEDWPLFLKAARSRHSPRRLDKITIVRKKDGVSNKKAQVNFKYQTDLIEIMGKEILPYLDLLPSEVQKKIYRRCKDKEQIFQYRFYKKTPFEKMIWFIEHPMVIFRRLLERLKNDD